MSDQPVVFFQLQPAETAPKDGSRFLALVQVWHFSFSRNRHVEDGTKWADVWYRGDRFDNWVGNPRIQTTDHPDIIGWIPLPSLQEESNV